MTYFWLVGRPRVPAYKGSSICATSSWPAGSVGGCSLWPGGRLGDVSTPGSLLGLLMAMLTFFVANTGLVSIAVGLEQKDFCLSASGSEKYS